MSDDLHSLIADLQRASGRIEPEVRAVVSRGALNIKDAWRKSWSGHPHIRHLPRAIGYDMSGNAYYSKARIGVDHDAMQGPLAHLIEWGSPTSGPIPGGAKALEDEEPKFLRALEDLAERLLDG